MGEAIEIKISIDEKDLNSIVEILDKVNELNDLIPEWNKIESDRTNEEIYNLLTKKFLRAEEIKPEGVQK